MSAKELVADGQRQNEKLRTRWTGTNTTHGLLNSFSFSNSKNPPSHPFACRIRKTLQHLEHAFCMHSEHSGIVCWPCWLSKRWLKIILPHYMESLGYNELERNTDFDNASVVLCQASARGSRLCCLSPAVSQSHAETGGIPRFDEECAHLRQKHSMDIQAAEEAPRNFGAWSHLQPRKQGKQ